MSLPSVRSSRGDSDELLIALRWAIRLLHDTDLPRVAVDSTDLDPSGQPIQVDFKPWKGSDALSAVRMDCPPRLHCESFHDPARRRP